MEQLKEPDLTKLKEACAVFIKDAHRFGRSDTQGSYDVFRTAIETFYGKNVWIDLKKK